MPKGMTTTDLTEQTRCIEDGAGMYLESNGAGSIAGGVLGY
jgi:hypothetical protein